MQERVEGTTFTVPVPLHDPLKRGTLCGIIRQSELPRANFETDESGVFGLVWCLTGGQFILAGMIANMRI